MSEVFSVPATASSLAFTGIPRTPFVEDAELRELRRLVADQYVANDRALTCEDQDDRDSAIAFAAEAQRLDLEIARIASDIETRPVKTLLDLLKRLVILERHYPSHERELIDSDNTGEKWLGIVVAGVLELAERSVEQRS